jgi:hypothetical protein
MDHQRNLSGDVVKKSLTSTRVPVARRALGPGACGLSLAQAAVAGGANWLAKIPMIV